MKNTLIGLDMVFVDMNGRVTSVAANVPASTTSTPQSQVATRWGFGRYVIELPAGAASRLGIRADERFAIPFLDAS